MGQKDVTEKLLEEYNDVFADIVNVLLFQGKQIIQQDELENGSAKSQYKADDSKVHEQERDVSKFWKNNSVKIVLYGLENQTSVDKDMPFRIMGYDGQSYRSQLDKSNGKTRYPVVTLVLYFGMKRWVGPKSLYEALKIPNNLKEYVSDYKLNIFEIAYLEPEQVAMFRSDFKFVADYFVQLRTTKDYVPSKETIEHVDAVLKIMSVLTKDRRFEEVQQDGMEVKNMCEVLDRAENRGIQQGIQQGIIEILAALLKDGILTLEEAASRAGMTKEDFQKKINEM